MLFLMFLLLQSHRVVVGSGFIVAAAIAVVFGHAAVAPDAVARTMC